jgi:hypothetical protein
LSRVVVLATFVVGVGAREIFASAGARRISINVEDNFHRHTYARLTLTRIMKTPHLLLLSLLIAAHSHGAGEWKSLFDGKTLGGWVSKGGSAKYHVENGVIVGTTSTDPSMNTFLCTTRDYADFELQLEVRCDDPLNSGIQIRSHIYEKDAPQPSNADRIRKKGEVYGYQCEIAANDKCTSGNFWDEGRFTKWHDDLEKKPGACAAYKPGTWNHYRIVAQGDRIRSWVNGVPCADFTSDHGYMIGHHGLHSKGNAWWIIKLYRSRAGVTTTSLIERCQA